MAVIKKFIAYRRELSAGAIGAVEAWFIIYVYLHRQWFADHLPAVATLVGLLIGLAFFPVYAWLTTKDRQWRIRSRIIQIGSRVQIDSFKLSPLLPSEVTVKITDTNRGAGWRIFVEMATRIATQRLGEKDGLIREALSSLYKLFEFVRTELKPTRPSPMPEPPDAFTVETYAILMLNDALRPLLARWHPRLKAWEDTGRPEHEWPLADLCRNDLEVTRIKVLAYAFGLGDILAVAGYQRLLTPQPPPARQPAAEPQILTWTDEAVLAQREANLYAQLSSPQQAMGWRIFVELASRVTTQSLDADSGSLRVALNSLYKIYELVRSELKQVPPSPAAPPQSDGGPTLEAIAFGILNGPLRSFLAKWHPQLDEWEKQDKPDKPESQWPEAVACRTDLKDLQQELRAATRQLGKAIGVRDVDEILPENPAPAPTPTTSSAP